MNYIDYDRLTDIVYTLSFSDPSVQLCFTTGLSEKMKNGERRFFHYEIEYSSRYNGRMNDRSIRRKMKFYFYIDIEKNFGARIILRPEEMPTLLFSIEKTVLPWFYEKKLYNIVEGELRITGKFTPMTYAVDDYHYIAIEPTVIFYEKENQYKQGVTMYFNNSQTYINISIDTFMGFYYILKNTDMYAVACSQVNYAKTQPYDINNFESKGLGSGGARRADDQFASNKSGADFLNKLGGKNN